MIQSVFRERYILLAPPGSSSRPAGTVLPGVYSLDVCCLLQEPHWPSWSQKTIGIHLSSDTIPPLVGESSAGLDQFLLPPAAAHPHLVSTAQHTQAATAVILSVKFVDNDEHWAEASHQPPYRSLQLYR